MGVLSLPEDVRRSRALVGERSNPHNRASGNTGGKSELVSVHSAGPRNLGSFSHIGPAARRFIEHVNGTGLALAVDGGSWRAGDDYSAIDTHAGPEPVVCGS